MNRPEPKEYAPYFQAYLNLVPEGNYFQLLKQNTEEVIRFFDSIPFEKENYRYAKGKWSIKEVLMHMNDTERVFSYRALVCLRGDINSDIQNMDENLYAHNADVSKRSLKDLVEEFKSIRKSTEWLFYNVSEAQSALVVRNSNRCFSGRALGYLIIGHIMHHLNVITEKYMNN